MIIDKRDKVKPKEAKVRKKEHELVKEESLLDSGKERVMYLNKTTLQQDIIRYMDKSKLTAKEISERLRGMGCNLSKTQVYHIRYAGNRNSCTFDRLMEIALALGYTKIEIGLTDEVDTNEIDKFFE